MIWKFKRHRSDIRLVFKSTSIDRASINLLYSFFTICQLFQFSIFSNCPISKVVEFSIFNFVRFSIFFRFSKLSNFQFCPYFNFCPIFNFVQFSIFVEFSIFVKFSILSNYQFSPIFCPTFWFCQFTILSRAVDWNFQSCFKMIFWRTLWFDKLCKESVFALYSPSLSSCLLATQKDRPQHKCFKKKLLCFLFYFPSLPISFQMALLQFALVHPFPDKSQGHLFSEKSPSLSSFLPIPVFKIMHIF